MFSLGSKVFVSAFAYGYALALALVAFIPGFNWLYSGHGGPAWLLLPFSLPVAFLVLYFFYATAESSQKPKVLRFAIGSLVLYMPASLASSFFGARSIQASFGLDVSPFAMWALFMSPFGLPFVW